MSRRVQVRAAHPSANSGPRVDIEPFAAWMQRTFVGWTYAEIAHELGLNERRVGRILKREQPRLSRLTVDNALTVYGRPDLLGALYPDE